MVRNSSLHLRKVPVHWSVLNRHHQKENHVLDSEKRPRDRKCEESGPDVKKIDSTINLRSEMASCAVGLHKQPVHPDRAAHRRPQPARARKKSWRCASLSLFWTCHFRHANGTLHHSQSSGPEQTTRRDVLDCRRGKRPSRRRPCRARGEPQGCTERRWFSLCAYTNVHYDRCRPQVAAA